jgi:arylsulfatase A-like enzyme
MMKTYSTFAAAAIALLVACKAPQSPAAPTPRTNVILISIDTLRPDHLGSYGYEPPTSPSIDVFRNDSVLFDQAIAHAPSTLHSHASILSSLLPHHHRASWAAKSRLPDGVTSLPEILQDAGYRTGAMTGGGQMDRVFGLDQGFESYEQPGAERFNGTVTRAIEWLESGDDRPFFLFLHTYEPHHPYDPDAEFLDMFDGDYDGDLPDIISIDLLRQINKKEVTIDDDDLAHIIAAYDAEIRSMDAAFGRLVDFLKSRGLYEEAMIVFTSDHGEEFGEHGRVGWHSHSLFDELLRVPLIVKYPGNQRAGMAVEGLVRSLDIAPTILEVLGIAAPSDFQGVALAERIDSDESGDAPAAISRMDRSARRDISSYRTARWKLYRNQLFDLDVDPGEQWDTAVNHPDVVENLDRELEETVSARKPFEEVQVVPDDSTLEELRALGYLQ